ncbi:hypothetical protein GF382_03585 [Candidatus Falkowbacteria bacterium]|nr:hypothetical protein [Candidatus Falkowbacteria bacterium]
MKKKKTKPKEVKIPSSDMPEFLKTQPGPVGKQSRDGSAVKHLFGLAKEKNKK